MPLKRVQVQIPEEAIRAEVPSRGNSAVFQLQEELSVTGDARAERALFVQPVVHGRRRYGVEALVR